MAKRAYERIKAGLEEAIAIARGEADPSTYRVHTFTDAMPPEVDVKTIRQRLKLTQVEFAQRFGFTPARVRDWEQGRSQPDGAIRAYLTVIAREPEAVQRALQAA
ncbi:MAG TPA: helix-turn-helix domain-containing protein [Beijerinckiaceae bacterium]|jgi:putative transcriptional regulator